MSFFGNIFNDDSLNTIDDRIDNIINSLPKNINHSDSDTISSNFISEFMTEGPQTEVDKLLQGVSISRERLERYEIYDETLKYVPIIKRILSVYISNILQKNPVDGKCILVQAADDTHSNDNDNENLKILERCQEFAKLCIKNFKTSLTLRKKILPNTLVYGDCFIEIIDIADEGKKKIDNSSSTLSISPLFEAELSNFNKTIDQFQIRKNYEPIKTNNVDKILSQMSEYFVHYETSKSESDKEKSKDNINFDNIVLKIYKPHEVIILETKTGNLLGYLIVSKDQTSNSINLTQTLSTLVGRVTNLVGNDGKNENTISDKLVRYILRSILEKTQKAKSGTKPIGSIDDLLSDLPADLFQQVKRLFIEHDIAHRNNSYNRMNVRFVSNLNMIHFTTPSAHYDPYGQSFIDSLVFPCKLYILSQLANVIIKLSRAAPIRKWTIDVGQTQMQAGMIQKLKRELYNTRVSVDDLNSFKSIPKILSD